jgi:hypothetical protein
MIDAAFVAPLTWLKVQDLPETGDVVVICKIAPLQLTVGVPVKVTVNGYKEATFVKGLVVGFVFGTDVGAKSLAVHPVVGLSTLTETVVPTGNGNKFPVVPTPFR